MIALRPIELDEAFALAVASPAFMEAQRLDGGLGDQQVARQTLATAFSRTRLPELVAEAASCVLCQLDSEVRDAFVATHDRDTTETLAALQGTGPHATAIRAELLRRGADVTRLALLAFHLRHRLAAQVQRDSAHEGRVTRSMIELRWLAALVAVVDARLVEAKKARDRLVAGVAEHARAIARADAKTKEARPIAEHDAWTTLARSLVLATGAVDELRAAADEQGSHRLHGARLLDRLGVTLPSPPRQIAPKDLSAEIASFVRERLKASGARPDALAFLAKRR